MEGWRELRLDELTTKIGSGATPTGGKKAYKSVGIPLIRSLNVHDGEFRAKNLARIDQSQAAKLSNVVVQEGDVLLNITGASIARCCTAPLPYLPARVNQHVSIIRPRSELVDPRFLTNLLTAREYKGQLLRNGEKAGSTRQALTKTQLQGFRISIPSLPEQERIVAILDEAFAATATATANTKKNLANARELFDSELNRVFSQKGDGWVEKTVGEVCENLDSRRIPITKSRRKSGSVPYYGASGIVDHVADFIFDEDLLLVSEDGANLLARTYPIAFSIRGKTWVNNHAHVLRFAFRVYQTFVEHYLNSISLAPYVSGMAQPKLNQRALNSIPVPWHSDESRISQVVDRILYAEPKTKELESICHKKLTALTELKQSILHKAFTGELTADAKAADRTLSEAGL